MGEGIKGIKNISEALRDAAREAQKAEKNSNITVRGGVEGKKKYREVFKGQAVKQDTNGKYIEITEKHGSFHLGESSDGITEKKYLSEKDQKSITLIEIPQEKTKSEAGSRSGASRSSATQRLKDFMKEHGKAVGTYRLDTSKNVYRDEKGKLFIYVDKNGSGYHGEPMPGTIEKYVNEKDVNKFTGQ